MEQGDYDYVVGAEKDWRDIVTAHADSTPFLEPRPDDGDEWEDIPLGCSKRLGRVNSEGEQDYDEGGRDPRDRARGAGKGDLHFNFATFGGGRRDLVG